MQTRKIFRKKNIVTLSGTLKIDFLIKFNYFYLHSVEAEIAAFGRHGII